MSPEKLTNRQIARVFQNIADLLEIKGEVIYKILAYRRAAESLSEVGRDINDIWQEGKLLEIPGVGKAIAEKIDELLSTGRLGFYDKLTAEVPVTLVELLQVPDLGPKKVGLFWHELGVTDLAGLEAAARSGKLRGLPGMGEKSEAKVIAGIESLSRRSRPHAPGARLALCPGAGGISCETSRASARWRSPAACAACAPPWAISTCSSPSPIRSR